MAPRADMDVVTKRKISAPGQESIRGVSSPSQSQIKQISKKKIVLFTLNDKSAVILAQILLLPPDVSFKSICQKTFLLNGI
jgi:hypothetical protein